MRISRRWRVALVWIFVLISVPCVASHRYVSLYLSRKPPVRRPITELLLDPVASKNPATLLAEANRLAFLFNWPKAEPFYSRAEELFRKQGDTRNEVYARVGRISAESGAMSNDQVSELLQEELDLPIAKTDPNLRLWCLMSKGYVDLNVNPASAKRVLVEAQTLAHTLGVPQLEARATGDLGIVTFLEGDAGRAATMAGDALLSAIATKDVGSEIRYLEIIGGGFLNLTRYKEALMLFDRAIKLTDKTPDAGFPFMAFEGRAEALIGQGKLEQAKEPLDRALTVARRDKVAGHESMILIDLGELALRMGDRERGKEYFQEAGRVAGKYKIYRNLAQAMINLVEIYKNAGDLKAAEECLSIAVDASRRVGDRYFLPRDLAMLAKMKAGRGDVDQAAALYENAEDVVDGMLVNLHEPYWSSSLAGAMSEMYLDHFTLEAENLATERAVHVVERIRGRTAAVLLENKISFSNNESEATKMLEDSVAQLQLRLMRSEDSKERANLLEQLEEFERRLEWAQKDEGVSKQVWFEKPASLKSIQKSLRADEIVLEYVLSEPHAYCVWITGGGAGLQRLSAGRQQTETLTRRYLEEIHTKRDDIDLAEQLYNLLLGPMDKRTIGQRVIVVPDGILHLLPFEVLRDPSGSFFMDNSTVSYAPASTVLQVLRKAARSQEPRRSFLGVGDARYEDHKGVSEKVRESDGIRTRLLRGFSEAFGTPLYDLPQTREEVLKISRVIGKDAVVLLGSEATETAFKSQPLADFNILHLAVHGFADPEFPERSGLILGVDPSSRDDGLLQVREITRLHFNAELVTLSACDSGVGKLHGEEGITNVPEAFLASGAKSVVASLWSADDTYTLALMESFYTHVAQGQDSTAALRQAKLDLLEQHGRQVPPYYWAAFVLVGDGATPIQLAAR
jgi:CHAT domain-containing protein/tetratricopeptide (TPR) repeat protein